MPNATACLHNNWQRLFRDGFAQRFDTILNHIAKDGPVSSSNVGRDKPRSKSSWWEWHPSKTALEWLSRTGHISVTRRVAFHKVYDLTENVIPAPHLDAKTSVRDHQSWACASCRPLIPPCATAHGSSRCSAFTPGSRPSCHKPSAKTAILSFRCWKAPA